MIEIKALEIQWKQSSSIPMVKSFYCNRLKNTAQMERILETCITEAISISYKSSEYPNIS